MEHKKRMMVLDATGARESDLPSSVELRPGEQMQFEGKTYEVGPSSHVMSDDGEVITTTYTLKSNERVASA